MRIGTLTIQPDPNIEQDFPKGKGKVIGIGKDKRYAEFYGKWHWYIIVRYENQKKEVFTFDLKDNCIESKEI